MLNITQTTQIKANYFVYFTSVLVMLLFNSTIPAETLVDKSKASFQIGLASVFVDKPRDILSQFENYLSQRLEQKVSFIQRRTYQELTSSLLNGQIKAAWVCTYPYVNHQNAFRLVAIPLYKKKPLYQSYFIVPKTDILSKNIADMKDKIFAYTDNQSFTGYFYPRYLLQQLGLASEHFFRVEFFTWGHVDSIKAVAEGLADGATVDGFIWDSLALVSPEITQQTRIVSRSPFFGFPPIVMSHNTIEDDFARLQAIFIHMQDDIEGKKLLAALNLDGFILPNKEIYRSASKVVDTFNQNK